jgi:hypothetical protein
MLSQKFESVIKKILVQREAGTKYDQGQPDCNMYMTKISLLSIFDIFNRMPKLITDDKDRRNYKNYICKGILDIDHFNNGIKSIRDDEIANLKYLDQMKQESQICIDTLLQASDINYTLDPHKLSQLQGIQLHKNFDAILLELHFKVMMQKIFFIWKSDPVTYTPDIMDYNARLFVWKVTYLPQDHVSKHQNIIDKMLAKPIESDLFRYMFDFLESLVKKYKDIDLLSPFYEN